MCFKCSVYRPACRGEDRSDGVEVLYHDAEETQTALNMGGGACTVINKAVDSRAQLTCAIKDEKVRGKDGISSVIRGLES